MSFLVEELEVLVDAPVVVLVVRYCHELVRLRLAEQVPLEVCHLNGNHGVAEEISAASHEVPKLNLRDRLLCLAIKADHEDKSGAI
jgi:hypothetical protein